MQESRRAYLGTLMLLSLAAALAAGRALKRTYRGTGAVVDSREFEVPSRAASHERCGHCFFSRSLCIAAAVTFYPDGAPQAESASYPDARVISSKENGSAQRADTLSQAQATISYSCGFADRPSHVVRASPRTRVTTLAAGFCRPFAILGEIAGAVLAA